MSAADSSSLSSLSPPPSSEDGRPLSPPPKASRKIIIPAKNRFVVGSNEQDGSSNVGSDNDLAVPPAARSPSPPYEPVLADNADIAFIVMFRSRFSDAFPKSLPHFGPQDVEKGVVDALPTPHVESLLCALLALVLNRKKPVERGHYGRALEEAISSQQNQWPRAWGGRSPLQGGRQFATMGPTERLTLLRSLVLWALNTSDAVSSMLKENYKVSRHEDDMNISLSVQSWGRDGQKHRFWLVEGQDDTSFRVYRESTTALWSSKWKNVAGSIDELREVADKLGKESAQASRRLSENMMRAIPRFEATEEKRKRREYRMARKAQFVRPEPGFSLYEGRTRGKRIKYTFSDEENDYDSSESPHVRRSLRHRNVDDGSDPPKPVITASGRRVRAPGDNAHGGGAGMEEEDDNEVGPNGSYDGNAGAANGEPPSRNAMNHVQGYDAVDELDDEAEASSSAGEWDAGDVGDEYDDTVNGKEGESDDDDEDDMDEDEEMDDDEDEDDGLDEIGEADGETGRKGRRRGKKQSLMVSLRYRQPVKETQAGPGGQPYATQYSGNVNGFTPSVKPEAQLPNDTTQTKLIQKDIQMPDQPALTPATLESTNGVLSDKTEQDPASAQSKYANANGDLADQHMTTHQLASTSMQPDASAAASAAATAVATAVATVPAAATPAETSTPDEPPPFIPSLPSFAPAETPESEAVPEPEQQPEPALEFRAQLQSAQ